MAVSFKSATESHTGTTGSASQASFDTVVPDPSPDVIKGLLVFSFVNANANDALSVKINPAGANIDVPAVVGGRAVDTLDEPGDCKAWFLGAGIPTGALTVRVNRNNNANVMYAVVAAVLASGDTEVVGVTLFQENNVLGQSNIDDGSPGMNSLRFAAANSGLGAVPAAGANSTAMHGIDFGARVIQTVRETVAGQGSRPVGFALTASDDRAVVMLAVREIPAPAGSILRQMMNYEGA